MDSTVRLSVRVEGVVQGVGFRPFVYSLATRLGLSGWVGNDVDGVFAEVEGPAVGVRGLAGAGDVTELLTGRGGQRSGRAA